MPELAEGARLLSECSGNGTVGSNPTLSATTYDVLVRWVASSSAR